MENVQIESKDLKWIKKHYGEKMMHLCRECFPKILDEEGKLAKIFHEHFNPNKELAEDIIKDDKIYEFTNYVFSCVEDKEKREVVNADKTASELFDEAGYILYPECETEKDVQAFKKYYTPQETLCTFRGGRLNSYRVWFAVKKDIDSIKRENFNMPRRQDKYGTSVISIQFSKRNMTLSIKNRYNHSVKNPDNTFNSNLDNIIPGLTDAFERDFGVKDELSAARNFEIDNYVNIAGKYYKYNQEIFNIYYCPNNIIIDQFEAEKLPNHQLLMDYFVVDLKEKTIELYNYEKIEDGAVELFKNIKDLQYIGDKRELIITKESGKAVIKLNEHNEIISLTDNTLTECKSGFLYFARKLQELNLLNVEKIADYSFHDVKDLKVLNCPKVKEIGPNCFYEAENVNFVNMPKMKNLKLFDRELDEGM